MASGYVAQGQFRTGAAATMAVTQQIGLNPACEEPHGLIWPRAPGEFDTHGVLGLGSFIPFGP